MVVVSAAFYGLCWWRPGIMSLLGVSHYGVWFLDTFGILAAIEAKRAGLDPHVYNPLNYFGGTHVYSHWWLWLEWSPLSRRDVVWLGPLVAVAGIATGWWKLRPRTWTETFWALTILCAPPLLLGLNRANVDLVFFALLSLCVPSLVARRPWLRLAGTPVLAALAAGLKFYPATVGLMVLGVRPLPLRRRALVLAVLLLLLVAVSVVPDMRKYHGDNLPQGLFTFGAQTALLAVGFSKAMSIGLAGLSLAVLGCWLWRRADLDTWKVPAALRTDHLHFILGAVLLTGSFLATINYGYRWIYAAWMIPFLCRLSPETRGLHWLRGLTLGLLGFALWSDGLVALVLNLTPRSPEVIDRWVGLFNAFQQPFIWSLFICLAGWLTHFVIQELTARE